MFCVFYFIKISKFALPGVMLIYERTSKDRKKERQIVGIPMGTNCVPLVEDLFLFCYERDFMLCLSDNNQTDIIEAFNSISRYLASSPAKVSSYLPFDKPFTSRPSKFVISAD